MIGFIDLQLAVEKEELTQALASELASSSRLKVTFCPIWILYTLSVLLFFT